MTNQSRAPYVISAAVALAVLLLAVVLLFRSPASTSVKIQGATVGRESREMVSSLVTSASIASVRCDRVGVCASAKRGGDPVQAWGALASLSGYMSSKDPSFVSAILVAAEEMKKDGVVGFDQSLWQFCRAYRETNDPRILEFVFPPLVNQLFALRGARKDEYLLSLYTMARTNMLEQMACGYSLVSTDSSWAALEQLPSKPTSGHIRESLVAGFRSQVLRLQRLLEEGEKKDTRVRLLRDDSRYSRHACWAYRGHLEVAEVLGDERSAGLVREFFKDVSFSRRDPTDLGLESLQLLLPCVEMAQMLRHESPAISNDYRFLLEKVLFNGYDGPNRPICDGDGSFVFLVTPGRRPSCEGVVKSVPDMAWIAYLLSSDSDSYEIPRV